MSSKRGSWRASSQGSRWGGGSRSSHSVRSTGLQDSRPCRHFLRGACNFGSRCRYSHDRSQDGTNRDSLAADELVSPEQAEVRTAYFDWRRLLRTPPNRFSGGDLLLAGLWADAVNILDESGREWHQMLAKDLVNDDFFGRQYINATIALDVFTDDSTKRSAADDFIKVLTHPSLVDCLSVRTYVAELYSIAGGANGVTALDFIAQYCRGLVICRKKFPTIYTLANIEDNLRRVSSLVGELLRRRQRLAFQDSVAELFVAVDDVADLLKTPQTMGLHVACTDHIATLRRMVELSASRLTAATDPSNGRAGINMFTPSRPGPAFPIELELPGGRHDNDHLDIGLIKIFPTVNEVMSTRDDFLPSTDFRQPHFFDDPIQRYLDTHFRLLRYDIFSPFVNYLHQTLLSFSDGAGTFNVHDGNVRAYVYHTAAISHVSVDDKRGFEAHISFSSPQYVRQKSASERRAWWEQSKRLEQGTLMCFLCTVDDRPMPLLLVVSDKSTDPSHSNNLVSEAHKGTISAKLATSDRPNLELLTRMYHHKNKGVLIDFPDLIPATFKPILENLKEMMLQTLPLREWIVPDATGVQDAPRTIPPPRYARKAGFAFSLGSILQDKTRSLTLSATAVRDDAALLECLVAETGLDLGQAAALIVALTTEYALIQGPPGTGKSYLGVKLLQVLLASKDLAGLGPVVVM